MQILRSYWHYWYTGNKLVAIISMILTTAALWLGLVFAAGLSIWGVILAVLLDTIGFWVVVIYAVALRGYLPSALVEKGDALVQNQLVLPILAAFLVGRIITFYVATFLSSKSQYPWVRKGALAAVAITLIAAVASLTVSIKHQRDAAAEAERQQAAAVENIKAQAIQTANDTAKAATNATKAIGQAVIDANLKGKTEQAVEDVKVTANQAAADAKDKLSDGCNSLAAAIGKDPKDYCQQK